MRRLGERRDPDANVFSDPVMMRKDLRLEAVTPQSLEVRFNHERVMSLFVRGSSWLRAHTTFPYKYGQTLRPFLVGNSRRVLGLYARHPLM